MRWCIWMVKDLRCRQPNVSGYDLDQLRKHEDVRGARVLVDGYTQAEVNMRDELESFHLLATSCQYDAKHDDQSRVVVVPAWRRDDLEMYARLTDWVISTGYRKKKENLAETTWPKLVKEQYFYSGGSLREFCRICTDLKQQVESDCDKVDNAQAYQLVYNFGGDRTKDQGDRVRRHYITDPNNEVHYTNSRYWKVSVDSGYALKLLGRHTTMKKQFDVFKYAETIGAGFLGIAYEQLFYRAIHEAFVKNTAAIVVKMRPGSPYDRIELCVPTVVCLGENEAECYNCLATLSTNSYWHPDYPFFPFIDAVTMCKAYRTEDRENHEAVVAYIQVTISREKTFKPTRLQKLNEVLNTNPNIAGVPRVFVVVGPDEDVSERFTLNEAPDPAEFVTMVGCFNPHQFAEEH